MPQDSIEINNVSTAKSRLTRYDQFKLLKHDHKNPSVALFWKVDLAFLKI